MTQKTKRLFRWFRTVWFIVGIAGGIWQALDDRVVEREVEASRKLAAGSMSPDTTPELAQTWLLQHGYRVVIWNPTEARGFVGMEDGADGKYRIVYGQRQVRTGRWLGKPTWLDFIFRFDAKERFHDVRAGTFPHLIGVAEKK